MNTAISASAGLNYITGSTFTAQSSVSFNNCFSSTYQAYKIICSFKSPSSDGYTRLRMRASGTDATGGDYQGCKIQINTSGSISSIADASAAFLAVTELDAGTAGTGYSAFIDMINPFVASVTTMFMNNTSIVSTGAFQSIVGGNTHNVATSYDGFTIYSSAGTFSGDIRVYGYKNS
jgi:hypothetical protein